MSRSEKKSGMSGNLFFQIFGGNPALFIVLSLIKYVSKYAHIKVVMWGGIAQLVSRPSLNLETRVQILVGAWIGSPNAWMREEEIASCKSHIPSVSLTNWCILIFKKRKKKKGSNVKHTGNGPLLKPHWHKNKAIELTGVRYFKISSLCYPH